MRAPEELHNAISKFCAELPAQARALEKLPTLHALRLQVEIVNALNVLLEGVRSAAHDTEPSGRL